MGIAARFLLATAASLVVVAGVVELPSLQH
jgi:hypothetical protein